MWSYPSFKLSYIMAYMLNGPVWLGVGTIQYMWADMLFGRAHTFEVNCCSEMCT